MKAEDIKLASCVILGLFISVGLLLLVIGGMWLSSVNRFVATAVEVNGEVVDVEYGSRSTEVPVFRFRDREGSEHTVRESAGQSPSPFAIGSRVVVLYEPQAPIKARIKSFGTLWVGPTFATAFGVLFTLVPGFALCLITFGRNRHKPRKT